MFFRTQWNGSGNSAGEHRVGVSLTNPADYIPTKKMIDMLMFRPNESEDDFDFEGDDVLDPDRVKSVFDAETELEDVGSAMVEHNDNLEVMEKAIKNPVKADLRKDSLGQNVKIMEDGKVVDPSPVGAE